MIAVHFESGLGNQMLDYVDYLAYQRANPDRECYMENVVFSIPESKKVIDFWNGYELDTVFGLKIPNISDVLKEDYAVLFSKMKKVNFGIIIGHIRMHLLLA